VPPSYQGVKAT